MRFELGFFPLGFSRIHHRVLNQLHKIIKMEKTTQTKKNPNTQNAARSNLQGVRYFFERRLGPLLLNDSSFIDCLAVLFFLCTIRLLKRSQLNNLVSLLKDFHDDHSTTPPELT